MKPLQRASFSEIVKRQLWQERGSLAIGLLSMLLLTLTELLSPWPLKIIFDYILLGRELPPPLFWLRDWIADGQVTAVALISSAILLIAAVRGVCVFVQEYLFARLGYQLVYTLRCELFAHLQQLSLSFHHRARAGELHNRITGETEVFKDVISESLLSGFSQCLTLIGMFAVLFWLNWKLALIALATVPVLLIALTALYRRLKITTRTQRRSESQMAARLNEVLTSLMLVKAFAREQYEHQRFAEESAQTLESGIRAERLAAAATRWVEMVKAAGLWAIVLYGALLVLRNELTPGDVLVFTAYLNDMYKPLRNLAKVSTRLARAAVGRQRIDEILNTEPEIWQDETAIKVSRLKGAIEFRQVSFDYGDGKSVLQNISLTIQPGQRVALVGPSGSGKSTLANLLLRFYHASSGEILLDGVNIEKYQRSLLRREIGIVIQDALVFGASIRENIAYGKPEATQAEIEHAARHAFAHEFIAALPAGYDTVISERGTTLSGGQRQRICLARALVKDPSVLILDEPTSAVDAESAALIHDTLEELREGRTTLVIAHHFVELESYDQIIVLRQGRIVEQGTHAELLARQGAYVQMLTSDQDRAWAVTDEEKRGSADGL